MKSTILPLVSLQHVSLMKNGKEILSDINLDIYPNEIVSIIGANWAGKTSLLDVILWLQDPTSGQVILHTKRIGYVPQKFSFDMSYPLTVQEFFGLYGLQWDIRSQWSDIIDKLSVHKLLHQHMGTLSWWELQKVLILLAIMKEPDILFLDEATAWVDAMGEKDFYAFLERLHTHKKISIVLVSHDVHTVFSYSNKVICLNKTICCTGKPEHVKNHDNFAKIFGTFTSPYFHTTHSWPSEKS